MDSGTLLVLARMDSGALMVLARMDSGVLLLLASMDFGARTCWSRSAFFLPYLLILVQLLGKLGVCLAIPGNAEVNGVLALLHPLGRQGGVEDELLAGDVTDDDGLVQLKLVLGQRSGLVAAKHVHAGHLLDGTQPGHDDSHVGEPEKRAASEASVC